MTSRLATIAASLTAVAIAATVGLALADRSAHGAPVLASPSPVASPAQAAPTGFPAAGSACSKPAPRTAAGFTAMFSKLDPAQWAAADVSISIKIGGRSVWLYGDTFSTGRFVHSSAIVQTGGCLHVSNGGAQLIPNDSAKSIYWISNAKPIDSTSLAVTARLVSLTGSGPWDFRPTETTRTALVTVSPLGDLNFSHWTMTNRRANPVGALTSIGPHHFTYGPQVHREFRLADGHYLTTVCQNYDDGVLHPLHDYAPLFRG